MDVCDAIVVGGGPAGSACAWTLRAAGLDVIVVDKAAFPRDKPCAGWITPQVVADLELDLDLYRRSRTLQPITGFRVGLVRGDGGVAVDYGRAISFGIRRCEFDDFLLRRSGARLLTARVSDIRRDGRAWVVNDAVRAPILVGAGGHFCPVARWLNRHGDEAPLVVAQELEFAMDAASIGDCRIEEDRPELYFSSDLKGYGWCVRKGAYLNLGLGRVDRHALAYATRAFVDFLHARGRIPGRIPDAWRGHAYLLDDPRHRRVYADGVLLVGDAAGLAYPQSGEGIGPAVRSGRLAADAILEGRLDSYEGRLRACFHRSTIGRLLGGLLPSRASAALGARLLAAPWFVRRVVLDRWFLRV
jgi:flavin-dependent dehydrogenase